MSPSNRIPFALCALAALAAGACGPARIETDPSTVQLHGRGQKVKVHAIPMAENGRSLASEVCTWSSSDEKVALVEAPHNEATVTAVGHGRATIRCAIGKIAAEVPVTVTLVSRLEIDPKELDLRILDEPLPKILAVRAVDVEGRDVQGRVVATRCLDEGVCRGDSRGQVWPVGPGDTKVVIQVDDGQAEAPVHVADARSAAARPRPVSGNPMEHLADPAPTPRGKPRR